VFAPAVTAIEAAEEQKRLSAETLESAPA